MLQKHNNIYILRGRIAPTFFRFSIPWALGMLLVTSASVVDGLFVGRYAGAFSLAAINLSFPIFTVISGLSIMIAVGSTVRCGWYRGRKEEEKANAMFTKAMILLLLGSIALSLLAWLSLPLLTKLLGADANLAPLVQEYMQIIIPFFPIFTIQMALGYFIRLDNRPMLAAVLLMSSAIINFALDYILVAHLNLKLAGAAWATSIAYSIPCIVIFIMHFFYNDNPHLRFVRTLGQWRELWQAAWNGISEMLNEMSSGFVILLINILMMQSLGPYGVAAFTIIAYVNWFCIMASYAISDSLGPLVSVCTGAGKHKRAYTFCILAGLTVAGIGLICFIGTSLWPTQMVSLFLTETSEQEYTLNIALNFISISRFMFLFCGINIVLTAYFTGRLQAGYSAIMAFARGLILPCSLLFILPIFLGNNGIYAALPLAEVITLGLGIYLIRRSKIKNL